ncbi:hypothetical protein UlMin_016917 [Ulmus minor]
MKTKVEGKFSEFFEKWVAKLEEHLQELTKVSNESTVVVRSDPELQALVAKVTAHLKEYYTVKWAAAHQDVVAFFYPVWLSPLENAYSWVTGWKPSSVFRMVDSLRKSSGSSSSRQMKSLNDMSEEKVKKIEELRKRIKHEEDKVEREMERLQVALADRKMVELARMERRIKNGEVVGQMDGLVDVALKGTFSGLEKVMKTADCVRLKTLRGVLDELTPLQCVEFLAATCNFQIQLRYMGKKKASPIDKSNNA